METPNPFIYGKVLQGDICHRPEPEHKLLANAISGQNTYVLGERRVGKSTLIKAVADHLRPDPDYLYVWVDFQAVTSIQDIQKRILTATMRVAKQIKDMTWFLSVFARFRPVAIPKEGGEVEFSIRTDDTMSMDINSLEDTFDYLQKTNIRHKILVIFDEFQDILSLDEGTAILGKMRGQIQHQKLPYVFSGSVRGQLYSIFNDAASPFYNSALGIHLDKFPPKDLQDFIIAKFTDSDKIMPPEMFQEIYTRMNGITGDIQKLCHYIWEQVPPKSVVSIDAIERAIKTIYQQDATYFEDKVNTLTSSQKKVLRGLVLSNNTSFFGADFVKRFEIKRKSEVAHALEALISKEILYKYQKEYMFYNPFFLHWLKSIYG